MAAADEWADYLSEKGLDPENQLSTDDFAGHLAHNTNLSIKAIEALAPYVRACARRGRRGRWRQHYEEIAQDYARKVGADGRSMAITTGWPSISRTPGARNTTWCGTGCSTFICSPPKIGQTEWSFYARHMQPDGLALDNRATFTKLDWEVWTATLGDGRQSADLVHRLVSWLDTTPSRVPATDWYDTITGKQQGFQARSVVGGVFFKALLDPEIAAHWKNAAP